jgi:hypothetical protein
MIPLSKTTLWHVPKYMVLASLSYVLVFETYMQIWVLTPFSSATTTYIYVDGTLREATPLQLVVNGIVDAFRFSFPRALAAASATTILWLAVILMFRRTQSIGAVRSLCAGSLLGGLVGLGIVWYVGGWGSEDGMQ